VQGRLFRLQLQDQLCSNGDSLRVADAALHPAVRFNSLVNLNALLTHESVLRGFGDFVPGMVER
jgi:hypothetical protein